MVEGERCAEQESVVLTPVEEAVAESSDYKAISEMLHNPRLLIRSSGKVVLKAMLDQAQSFGWSRFGSHIDGYSNVNCIHRCTGRVQYT